MFLTARRADVIFLLSLLMVAGCSSNSVKTYSGIAVDNGGHVYLSDDERLIGLRAVEFSDLPNPITSKEPEDVNSLCPLALYRLKNVYLTRSGDTYKVSRGTDSIITRIHRPEAFKIIKASQNKSLKGISSC